MEKMKIDLLPNHFVNEDGLFEKEKALLFCGKIAGICYDEEGYSHTLKESDKKTERRVNRTLTNGHHSIYDHVYISFYLQNVPKILAMVLNNEKMYTTSERSARYTKIVASDGSVITEKEMQLYNKWLEIFKKLISNEYSCLNASKIEKLAQENARYFVTVFMPTELIYTTSLRQINYIVSWMEEYIINHNHNDYFESRLAMEMEKFINIIKEKNVLDERLMRNEKERNLSLFGQNLEQKQEHFGENYATYYRSSWSSLAQAERSRTLHYECERLKIFAPFVPPILNTETLKEDYIADMMSVKDKFPQGEKVGIYEMGTMDDFILKAKERLCTSAQLEVMEQTKVTLQKYLMNLEKDPNVVTYKRLERFNNVDFSEPTKMALQEELANLEKKGNVALYKKLKRYNHGARCTFPDYSCVAPCNFNEGITLTRKI